MSKRLGHKSVLITGCTPGGIGHALCLEFHKHGLHVIATARNPKVMTDLAELGMSTVSLDVTNRDSIATCHKAVEALTGGRLDILVNNAGRTHTHPALDLDIDDVRETFETNVFGVMAMVAAFSDQLIAAKGLIINMASLSAVTPYIFGSAYCASKGAIVSYSRTLRHEVEPFGVKVMVCMTGTVKSNIASRTHRTLPENSLYWRVSDVFERRLVFSQTQATVTTESYCEALVTKALRPEMFVPLRDWIGRPDWFWCGGMATLLWWALTLIGEWVVELFCYRLFEMHKLKRIVQQEEMKAKSQ
ncbi:NAD(P)-binding protein [Jackrogersella minutella]|nr:NAD(P)-binding protein [Jackrogersella minutella]